MITTKKGEDFKPVWLLTSAFNFKLFSSLFFPTGLTIFSILASVLASVSDSFLFFSLFLFLLGELLPADTEAALVEGSAGIFTFLLLLGADEKLNE